MFRKREIGYHNCDIQPRIPPKCAKARFTRVPRGVSPQIQTAAGAKRTETLFTPRNDNRVGLYETVLDKGEVVVSGCVADKVTFSQPFEFRTGLKAAPEAWHSLTVRHDGTDMVVTLDGRTARQKVDLPAVFMNTAILGGAPHTGNPFFTGRVRKLVVDHACTDAGRL